MADTELQFRTATFGGFQKQDVLLYIETMTREHREKLDGLQRKLDEAGEAQSAREGELAAAREREEKLGQELQGLREELSAARREGEERQKELARLETELAELRREKTAAEELLTETEARLTETKEKLARRVRRRRPTRKSRIAPPASSWRPTAGPRMSRQRRRSGQSAPGRRGAVAEPGADRIRQAAGGRQRRHRTGQGRDGSGGRPAGGDLPHPGQPGGAAEPAGRGLFGGAHHRPPDPLPLDDN